MDKDKNKKDFSKRKIGFNEKTLDAVWTVDSETGIQYLLDRQTGRKIASKDRNNVWIDVSEYK